MKNLILSHKLPESNCKKCYWFNQCDCDIDDDVCDDFTWIEEEDIDDYIEKKRNEFHNEWNEYLNVNNESED